MKHEDQVLKVLLEIEDDKKKLNWPKFVTKISHQIDDDVQGDEDICFQMIIRRDSGKSVDELARELNTFDAFIRQKIFATGTNAWPSFHVTSE